jgi:hypothetical protein
MATGGKKIPWDVELFLSWVYQYQMLKHDGLFRPKPPRLAVPAWIQMIDTGACVDEGRRPRLPVRDGPPHTDALRVAFLVQHLPETRLNWRDHRRYLLGDLAHWVDDNGPPSARPLPVRKAILVSSGSARLEPEIPPPPIEISPIGFVIGHAINGTRPHWDIGRPKLQRGLPALIGRQIAKDKYTAGSCCPLAIDPSPRQVAEARFDYMVWHQALCAVATASVDLKLEDYALQQPSAPAAPWLDPPSERPHSTATSSRIHSPSIVPQNFS